MKLSSPQNDNRPALGMHYLPDQQHYRQADIQAWLPELKALGIRWLILNGSLSRAVPESFLEALLQASITPVIHLAELPLGQPVDLAALATLAKSYARWGVQRVVLFEHPNEPSGWAAEQFHRPNLIDRFLDHFLPTAQVLLEAGLQPILPPLRQGGTYWDLAFLEAVLVGLQKRRQSALLAGLHLGCYAFCFDKPATWGFGGGQVWQHNRPYYTPSGSQDQLGWHSPTWYAEICQKVLGRELPILMLAGGPLPTLVNAEWHQNCIDQIMATLQETNSPHYPDSLLNVCLGYIANSQEPKNGWYLPTGGTLPAVALLKQRQNTQRNPTHNAAIKKTSFTEAQPQQLPTNNQPKQLEHYLLLPTYRWGSAHWHWELIGDFVRKFQPAVGFSLQEAAIARQVTILGDTQGISEYAEAQLRLAGCEVDRIDENDVSALQKELGQRVRTAQRFGSAVLVA